MSEMPPVGAPQTLRPIASATFAAGGSVLDHRFGESDAYSLGVEEEYMLLDARSFDLVQGVEEILADMSGEEFEYCVTRELMQSVLEVATPVCRSVAEVDRELRMLRGYVAEAVEKRGLTVGSAGTHPFSLFEAQLITAKERYRHVLDRLQYVARRELVFGLHIHVAVDDADKAIQVVNGLLPELASLVALSASSPFWRGEPTGLHSSRHMISGAFPRSGLPPRFRDYEEYAEVIGRLETTGCINDYTYIWWDVRPHPRLGTVEVRVCDAVTRVEDAVALAAYCQSLVKLLCEQYESGQEIPAYHPTLTGENKWLAARYGLGARLVDLPTRRRHPIPIAKLIRRKLQILEPHARELGCERELEGVHEILARGNGADRQLQGFEANHNVVELTREITKATLAGATSARRVVEI